MINRFKAFDLLHRGIRNALAQLLLQAGKTDFGNPPEVACLGRTGQEIFSLLSIHAADEEEIILAALEEKLPGATSHMVTVHRKLEKLQTELESQLHEITLRSARGESVKEQGRIFYWALNEFYARYLLYMLEEEVDTQELLWQYFTDIELMVQRRQTMLRMSSRTLLSWLKYIVPAQSQHERAVFLRGLSATMPYGHFAQAIQVVEGVLSATEWQVLDSELGLAP
ncbi:MAG: hemerythrin domain-containing protein [Cytophagales bacterium]|nr:hemerythrin domain-containing protein [Cytophagales bacterium]